MMLIQERNLKALNKYTSSQKKTDLYDIGDGLTLMNIISKNSEGKMQTVDTYIGAEGAGFSCVSHVDSIDEPGTVFSYARYMRLLEANLPMLLDFYRTNTE